MGSATLRKALDLLAILIILLAISSFWIFRNYFLAPVGVALALSLVLSAGAVFLAVRRKDISDILSQSSTQSTSRYGVLAVVIVILCLVLLTYYACTVLLLMTPILWADEWHMIHRLLFSDRPMDIILSPYNQHPTFLLNAIYAINLFYLRCNELWFLIINTGSIFVISFVYFRVIRSSTRGLSKSSSLMLSSIAGLFAFWILGGNNFFWFMHFVPVMGAVIAMWGLARQGHIGFKRGFALFLVGALIANLSFSTGAVLWVVGIIASLLLAQSIRQVSVYVLLAVVVALLSMRYLSVPSDAIQGADISQLFQAVPIFFGGVFTVIFKESIPPEQLQSCAMTLGIAGCILVALLLYSLRVQRGKKIDAGVLFAVLLVSFALGCALIIALGRLDGKLSIMLSGRYTCWSVLFWIGLLMLAMIRLSRINDKSIRRFTIPLFAIGAMLFLIIANNMMIKERLISFNIGIRGKADVIVHPDTKGNEQFLWQPGNDSPSIRNKMIEVTNRWNIYRNDPVYRVGEQLMLTDVAQDRTYKGQLSMSIDQAGNYYTEGYVRTGDNTSLSPEALVVVQNNTIVGLGFPYSDYYYNLIQKGSSGSWWDVFDWPIRHYPGYCDYYYAQFRLKAPTQGGDVKLYAYTRDHRYVQIEN